MADPAPIHLSVATTDPDVAHDSLRRTYAGADIRVPRDSPSFQHQQDVQGDSDLSLGHFRLEGRGRVRLELEDTVTPAVENYWNATHDFLHVAMNDPDIASAPLLRADLSRRIAVATLMGSPRRRDRRSHRRASVAARQAAYRSAVEFMHGALAQPITVEDVARHVHLSTTELTRAFRVDPERGPAPAGSRHGRPWPTGPGSHGASRSRSTPGHTPLRAGSAA